MNIILCIGRISRCLEEKYLRRFRKKKSKIWNSRRASDRIKKEVQRRRGRDSQNCQNWRWWTWLLFYFLSFFFYLFFYFSLIFYSWKSTRWRKQKCDTITGHMTLSQKSHTHIIERRVWKVLEQDEVIPHSNGMLALWMKHGF